MHIGSIRLCVSYSTMMASRYHSSIALNIRLPKASDLPLTLRP